MFPVINICISLFCFGYVSAVERGYSTQPGEMDVYLNNENNTSLSDLYNITNEEDSFKGLTYAGELEQVRPTENVRLKDWNKYKCIFGKEEVVTMIYSASNVSFKKGDESKNGTYCFIFICDLRINGSMSTGYCFYVVTVNATELEMSGVKDEEIVIGKTPGIYVQFLLVTKNDSINYVYNGKNKINNEEIGVVGPLHEEQQVNGERKGMRLIKVLEEADTIPSEMDYCVKNTKHVILVVYNALDGTFTEVQAMNGTIHLVAPGFYRVNTDLTIRICVHMYYINNVELTTKFLELSKIHAIPFNRPFVISLTPRVFIKAHLASKTDYNIYKFVNFTYNDFIKANTISDFIQTIRYQILYVTATISILGNLLICAVIIKYKTMRNSPNMYVFSLAVSDILRFSTSLYYGLINPNNIVSDLDAWIWYSISVISSASDEVNIWTTVGITVDRYVAICHPFLARTVSTQSKAVKINIAIWIVLFFHSLFYVSYVRLHATGFNAPGMGILRIILYNTTTYLILFVLLPMFIIIVLYVFIVRSIFKSSKLKGSSNTRGQSMTGKSLKLSVAIVVQFFVCYVPIYSFNYLKIFLTGNGIDQAYIEMVKTVFQMTFLLASAMDLFVYALVSKNFRDCFKDILCLGWIRR